MSRTFVIVILVSPRQGASTAPSGERGQKLFGAIRREFPVKTHEQDLPTSFI